MSRLDRKRREYQSDELQKRIKKGQERAKGRRRSVITGDIPQIGQLKDGTHICDVIPYPAGKYDALVEEGSWSYTFEFWVHPRVGPNDLVFICLAEMYNKPCPICKERQRLRDVGKDESWKKLWPKRRNLYNIILYDKGEEDKGVQVMDVAHFYFEKHLMAISKKVGRHGKKDKTIDFADPKNGRSISWTIEPAKSKDDYPSFLGFTFEERDYKISDEHMESAFILDQVVHIPKYQEVEEAFFASEEGSEKSNRGSGRGTPKDDDEGDDKQAKKLRKLLEEVDDLEKKDELGEFIEDNDLEKDVTIKNHDDEDDIKEKIVDALREKYGAKAEEKKPKIEHDYDYDDVMDMSHRKLTKVCKKLELDTDPDDFDEDEKDEVADFQQAVATELGLEDD